LLNWISNANSEHLSNSVFNDLNTKIKSHKICSIEYNPSKTAAIVDNDCRSAIYMNFVTKQTYSISKNNLANHVNPSWLNDSIATVEASCGTGCMHVVIFEAPSTIVSCADHEYRIEFLDQHEPPDYYHNRPLLIDIKKRIYVCYDNDDNIQVFPFPTHAYIRPPKGFFSEKATIRNNKLIIFYENGKGEKKQIEYGKL
jgi:hypothetical protein